MQMATSNATVKFVRFVLGLFAGYFIYDLCLKVFRQELQFALVAGVIGFLGILVITIPGERWRWGKKKRAKEHPWFPAFAFGAVFALALLSSGLYD
jgi:hypothetical protein